MSTKVLLLSDTNSEHTEKWALGLASKNIKVGLFSFNKATYNWFDNNENIELLYQPDSGINANSRSTKLNYIGNVRALKKIIKKFQPDVLHAHYATSYGLVGALTGFHPYVISVWGTDVMKFPQKNIINRKVLTYNFKKADAICATSNTIKEYVSHVIDKKVEVIPFGVDLDIFKAKAVKSLFAEGDFIIGSIKPLEKLYNIDVLVESFIILSKKHSNVKLIIIGEGRDREHLMKICADNNISDKVIFTGRINFSEISNYFNMLDVLVNISDYESFGVSVIEAMACQKPVIVTDVGGLKEVVENTNYGALVKVGDVNETVEAIEKFYLDKDLKIKTGENCRKKVIQKYNWDDNVMQMIKVYEKLLKK